MKPRAWKRVVIIVGMLVSLEWLLATDLLAESGVVLDGLPTVRVDSDGTKTLLTTLKGAEREKMRVLIVRSAGKFWWATRDNRELIHHESGAHHYFIDPRGGGYVKVFDSHALPESARPPGARYRFYEHVSIGLSTITYWGEAEALNLKIEP